MKFPETAAWYTRKEHLSWCSRQAKRVRHTSRQKCRSVDSDVSNLSTASLALVDVATQAAALHRAMRTFERFLLVITSSY